MNTDFLLHSNINKLYKGIRERIQQQINYNIDKKEEKYRGVINKLLIKISKKDGLHIEDLNSMALQTICPFLISKIQNKKTPNISFTPNKVMDRIIPQSSLPIQQKSQELDSFYDHSGSNIINTDNNIESVYDNSSEHFENYNHEQENTIGDDNYLQPSMEGFENYSHSNENNIEDTGDDPNMTEHFQSTIPMDTLPSGLKEFNEKVVEELKEYEEAVKQTRDGIIFNELKSKQLLIHELKTNKITLKNEQNIHKNEIKLWIDSLPDEQITPDISDRPSTTTNQINNDNVGGVTSDPTVHGVSKNNYKNDFKSWVDTNVNGPINKQGLIDKLKEYSNEKFTYNEFLAYKTVQGNINNIYQDIEKDGLGGEELLLLSTNEFPFIKRKNNTFFITTVEAIQTNDYGIQNIIRGITKLQKWIKEENGMFYVRHPRNMTNNTILDQLEEDSENSDAIKKALTELYKVLQAIINSKLSAVSKSAVDREEIDVKKVRSIAAEAAASYTTQEGGKMNQEIIKLKKELETIKGDKLGVGSAEKFLSQYQTSPDSIKHKTMLILDVVRHAGNPKSANMFFSGSTPAESNITEFEIILEDPITIPNNTEVTLEYFSIYKFRGQTRSYLKETKQLEEFDSFVVKINGGNFDTIKNFSNTDSFSERATVVVPNDAFGFSDSNEGAGDIGLQNQTSYTIKPKSNYVGTIEKSTTIHKLKIDLMGTFVDALSSGIEGGANTWTYLYPYAGESRCRIGLMLRPIKN